MIPASPQGLPGSPGAAGHRVAWPRWPGPIARQGATLALGILLLLGPPAALRAASDPARVQLAGSIREIASQTAAPAGSRARMVRAALTAVETAAPMDVEVTLQMRNFAELQARIARGEIISRAEMAAKYFPLAADYEKMVAWLTGQGLTVSRADSTRLSVFVRGTVSQLARVFQVDFARVATNEGEFTSAVTAPSIPAGLASSLLGVNGLQPEFHPHQAPAGLVMQKASLTSPYAPPYLAPEITKAYGADALGVTGAGQTIAIVIDCFPINSDLTAYWAACGINQSLANLQAIHVPNTPNPPDPTTLDDNGYPRGIEAAIDAELTSSVAPGATIRVYATGSLSFTYLSRAYQQIYQDLPGIPGLRQVNLSYGISEASTTFNQRQSDAQNFAALASQGVTIFASSGDGGSNPDSGGYDSTAPAAPSHPASDPNVTGVGATTLRLDSASGTITSETGWSLSQTIEAASGGGISLYFSRPDWQSGPGVPGGTRRLVPDVATVGDPRTGCYIIFNGSGSTVWGGTSVSAPIWSGFGALLNQARANAGLPSLGLLGPKIYPLIGTTSFRDITTGNNGLYSAGPGYDMVSGIGTPVMTALAQSLAPQTSAPQILQQPASQTVVPGQNATFTVNAAGAPPLTYQWQREPAGGTAWSNLAASATYAGVNSATLTVSAATAAMSGDLFQCVVSNGNGSVTSAPPVALVVANPLTVVTVAGRAGNAGSADGTGSAARFNGPSDVAVDGAGNLFVTDTNNDTVRKVAPDGTVTTLAGLAGTTGSTDGAGSAARFNSPTGITVDAAGNLYVADTDNHTIRKITPAGVTSTVAGQAGTAGSANGVGTAAQFSFPSDVTVDGAGNLFVADTNNETIRRIAPDGTVTVVAGRPGSTGSADGVGTVARFASPEGVAVDGAGNLYVADTNNHTIRKIAPDATVSTLAGLAGASGSNDGAGSVARLQFPSDLAVDGSGNLYVADTDNHTIRMITPAGLTGTVAGQPGTNGSADGTGSAAQFYYPTGVAVDGAGNVYVADTSNHTVREGMAATAPRIVTQPQSQNATAGSTVTLSVTASGAPAPTYQWYFGTSPLSGATSASLTLSNIQLLNAGGYYVTATNFAGTATSDTAMVTVTGGANPAANSGGSGGGGGGALGSWFVVALALAGAVRGMVPGARRRRPACSTLKGT